jgi:hypothetical protein
MENCIVHRSKDKDATAETYFRNRNRKEAMRTGGIKMGAGVGRGAWRQVFVSRGNKSSQLAKAVSVWIRISISCSIATSNI